MKRIVLTASLVAVITVVLVVVGVAVVDNYLNRIYDAKFVSADGEASINFEKVSKDEVEQIWGSMGFYPIDNETFYEKYIAGKNEEWREYSTMVSQWEINKYLIKY